MFEPREEVTLDLDEVKVLLHQLGLDRRLITEQSAICVLALADGAERDSLLPGKKRLRDGARIHDIIEFARHECGKEVAENTRESYRKLSLQPLCEEGLVVRHQLSTNDPKTFYRLHPEMLRLLTCPAPLERRWLARELAVRLSQGETWKQQRRRAEIPVEVGQPQMFFLSPGTHRRLAAEVVEVYAPLFLKAPRVVYLGDTRHKGGYQNRDLMRELNLPIQVTAISPMWSSSVRWSVISLWSRSLPAAAPSPPLVWPSCTPGAPGPGAGLSPALCQCLPLASGLPSLRRGHRLEYAGVDRQRGGAGDQLWSYPINKVLPTNKRQDFDELHLRFGTEGKQCVRLPDTLIIHYDHISTGGKGLLGPRNLV